MKGCTSYLGPVLAVVLIILTDSAMILWYKQPKELGDIDINWLQKVYLVLY